MPSVSEKQHNFVAVQAGKGKKWAKEWLKKDKGWKKLPVRSKKKKGYKKVMSGSSMKVIE